MLSNKSIVAVFAALLVVFITFVSVQNGGLNVAGNVAGPVSVNELSAASSELEDSSSKLIDETMLFLGQEIPGFP